MAMDGTKARSICGDIDADGRNEIIWSSYDNWRVYKAVGIGQYQQIFSLYPTGDWWARVTLLTCCDLNKNGYPEVVEAVYRTTNPAEEITRIWEIEACVFISPMAERLCIPVSNILLPGRSLTHRVQIHSVYSFLRIVEEPMIQL